MKRRLKSLTASIWALGSVMGISLVAGAEDLTYEAAVSWALKRAPELAAAQAGLAAAAARAASARAAYVPRVTVDASYIARSPRNELPISLPAGLGMPAIGEIDDIHHVRAGGQVGWRLFDLARGERYAAAKIGEQVEQAKIEETAASLAFATRASFLAALFARDVEQIAGESLRLALSEEKRARLRAEVGTGSKVALAQASVRVASLRAQYQRARNDHLREREKLANLLGIEDVPTVKGDLEQLAGIHDAAVLEENNVSPTVKMMAASQAAAQKMAVSIGRTFWPTINIFGRGEYEYPHNMRLQWGALWSGGAMLNWDLFDGAERAGKQQEVDAQSRQLERQREAAARKLARSWIDLRARARSTEADLSSARDTLTQTQIYLRVAKAAYEAGTGTHLEVNNAEVGLDQANIAVRQALLQQALIKAESLMLRGIAAEKVTDASVGRGQ